MTDTTTTEEATKPQETIAQRPVLRWANVPMERTVHQAVIGVRAAVGAVRKDSYNTHGKFNFRGIDAIVNATAAALVEHGVSVVPHKVLKVEHGQIAYGKDNTRSQRTSVTIRFRVYGPRGDWFPVEAVGEAFDSGDKATPKASTVAHRTALLQLLHIPTDEPDPDSHTYGGEEQAYQPQPTELDKAKARAWDATRGAGDNSARLALLEKRLAALTPPAEIPTATPADWTAVAVDLELNGFDVQRPAEPQTAEGVEF